MYKRVKICKTIGCEKVAAELLSGAEGVDQEAVGRFLLCVFVMLEDQVQPFLRSSGSFCEKVSEGPECTADFLVVIDGDGRAFVDRGRDQLIVVGNLPENLAVRDFLDFFFGEAGN